MHLWGAHLTFLDSRAQGGQLKGHGYFNVQLRRQSIELIV